MRTMRFILPGQPAFFSFFILWASLLSGFAQSTISNNPVPVVTIRATVSNAWDGTNGVFTLFRSGNPEPALEVYCCISGTASNGVDYQTISQFVPLPSGVMSNTVVIKPIGVSAAITKTVVLELCGSPTASPVNYGIGSPSNATVYIGPPGIAPPPAVSIISPTNGQVYDGPTNITLIAHVSDATSPVTNVEFFAGTNDLGKGIPVILDPPGVEGVTGLAYVFNWMDVPANYYAVAAVAAASNGVSFTSPVVDISVIAPGSSNGPAVVRLVSPPNGSVYHAPADIPLIAYADYPGHAFTAVEFYAGTNDLGSGHLVTAVPPPLPSGAVQPPILTVASNYWELVWSNAPAGTNISLTALATSDNGLLMISPAVLISVLPPVTPPPTNLPVVDIVATDPVAIAGTNCWVWPGETNLPPVWAAWPTAVCRMFTNCGPKTATFTVRRLGETNDDLTVLYAIGGTASNGVDYVAIPGFATIPAGEKNGLITIVPIHHGSPDAPKTVILALTPSTNTPPDYLLGLPARAGAIIVDSDGPRPVTAVLSDKSFHLTAPGPDAAWFAIEYSTNLSSWIPICTNQVVNGSVDFVDPDAQTSPSRFYRAVPVTVTPSE